jgi:hypothetical protein
VLTYKGKGSGDILINNPGGAVKDVAFGPVPEILAFTPLGQGRSALIRWSVKFRIPELQSVFTLRNETGGSTLRTQAAAGAAAAAAAGNNSPGPVLQYNYEASVNFDSEGYSTVSLHGTLEIPLNRSTPTARTLSQTVEDYRQFWLDIKIDLTRFEVTERTFNISRDKRTIEWSFAAKELAPMGRPIGATKAGGSMKIRPKFRKTNLGIIITCIWEVSLSAHYTIRADFPRRAAWQAFVMLLWSRMWASINGRKPPGLDIAGNQLQVQKPQLQGGWNPNIFQNVQNANAVIAYYNQQNAALKNKENPLAAVNVAFTGFDVDEGLYDDSKSISFGASWVLLCTWESLFAATGLWTRPPGTGGQVWATSMDQIMGWRSWLSNTLDPRADVIVDFGGGSPPLVKPF